VRTSFAFPSKQKVIFLGDQGVGKTSILSKFINGTFNENDRVAHILQLK